MINPICNHCNEEITLTKESQFWNRANDKIIWCDDCGKNDFIILSQFGLAYAINKVGYNVWYDIGEYSYNKLKGIKKITAPVELKCKICTKRNFSNENICWWCGATKSYFQPSI